MLWIGSGKAVTNEKRSVARRSPGFEVQLDGFAKIGASGLNVFALGSDAQFGAAGDIPIVFLRDERREAIVHINMLADAGE
jgi:hypothetical protein